MDYIFFFFLTTQPHTPSLKVISIIVYILYRVCVIVFRAVASFIVAINISAILDARMVYNYTKKYANFTVYRVSYPDACIRTPLVTTLYKHTEKTSQNLLYTMITGVNAGLSVKATTLLLTRTLYGFTLVIITDLGPLFFKLGKSILLKKKSDDVVDYIQTWLTFKDDGRKMIIVGGK